MNVKEKIFLLPSLAVSLASIVVIVLFMFWRTQENKFYILELALPFLVVVALFFLIGLKHLGEKQQISLKPSAIRVFLSASIIIGILTLAVYIIFLLIPAPPADAVSQKPGAIEALGYIFISVFIPLWSCFTLGGLVQFTLMRSYQRTT